MCILVNTGLAPPCPIAKNANPIIFEVCIETRVKAGDDREAALFGIPLRAAPKEVGRSNMDDVGRKPVDIFPDVPWKAKSDPIIRSTGDCD